MMTADPPVPVTVPKLASRLGLSLHELTGLLSRRGDLAAKIVRVSGRRLVMPADLPAFEQAASERGRRE